MGKLKTIRKNFYQHFRLVLRNDDTFREAWSIKLTPFNLFVTLVSAALILITINTLIIAYTPLREYIPGYGNFSDYRKQQQLMHRLDSLERAAKLNDNYVHAIQTIIDGNTNPQPVLEDEQNAAEEAGVNAYDVEIDPSAEELKFRSSVENASSRFGNGQSVAGEGKVAATLLNHTPRLPLQGEIIDTFNPQQSKYGVTIQAWGQATINAAFDGTVIFADRINAEGFVIVIQHFDRQLTVYKGASVLLKHRGDRVHAGTPIAQMGSSAAPLVFEWWVGGIPVNPVK